MLCSLSHCHHQLYSPHAGCQPALTELLLFASFHPWDSFSPVMLTEPINLSALISMLMCSPGGISPCPPAAVECVGPTCPLSML